MKILAFLILLSVLPLNSIAQTDSLQRYLVKPSSVINNPTSSEVIFHPIEPNFLEQPYIVLGTNYTMANFVMTIPPCGDTYHDNGQLASHIECKDSLYHGFTTYWNEKGIKTSESYYKNGFIDGKSYSWSDKGIKTSELNYANRKQHGKAIYWSNSGHKTSEYTYAYGRVFKEKTYYTHSKLKSIEHFTYTKKGNRLLHGTCTYYSDNAKEINRYNKGEFQGISQWFKNGIKILEQIYDNDYLQSQKKWNSDGILIGLNTYSKTGKIEHLQDWDANGILIKEQFHHLEIRKGTWMSYHPPTNSRTLTFHTDTNSRSQTIKKEVYINDILLKLIKYTNNFQSDIIYYYSNGQKQFHTRTTPNRINSYLAWDENNNLTDSIQWKNDKYIGTGFYSNGDTLFKYTTENTPINLPIQRWAMIENDTIREDYVINSYAKKNQLLHSNYYSNTNGIAARTGIWSFYNGNSISHALTYVNGNITGRAVYYDSTHTGLTVSTIGFYQKGIKHGKWTSISDSTKEEYTYKDGALDGKHYKINPLNDTLIETTYQNDMLNGQYFEYSTEGFLTIKGFYQNGLKAQLWEYYNSEGIILKSGLYKNDQRAGKWTHWYINEKGKRKKRKVDSDVKQLI